jgi:peptidoglycan/LPS O-acetylase OafA/YrhL
LYDIAFHDDRNFINSVLSHPAAVYIGRLSYSLYLYHYGAFMVATWIVVTYGFSKYGLEWLCIGVPLTILGAAASYHIVEKKFFALRRRFGSVV